MRTQRCKHCKDTYCYDDYGPIKECSCNRKQGEERYTLEQDDDGHWYIVPCRLIHEFQNWLAMIEETEEDYGYPEGVIPVDGSPSLVSFTNPQVQS